MLLPRSPGHKNSLASQKQQSVMQVAMLKGLLLSSKAVYIGLQNQAEKTRQQPKPPPGKTGSLNDRSLGTGRDRQSHRLRQDPNRPFVRPSSLRRTGPGPFVSLPAEGRERGGPSSFVSVRSTRRVGELQQDCPGAVTVLLTTPCRSDRIKQMA